MTDMIIDQFSGAFFIFFNLIKLTVFQIFQNFILAETWIKYYWECVETQHVDI